MSAAKRKGTAFEVAVRDYLDSCNVAAFRTAPAGTRDEGDLLVLDWDAILECKATKTIDLAGAVNEARIEAVHAKRRYGIAVIKRRMANVSKSYVVMELDQFVDLMQKP
jgi:hypothetical protein